MFIKKAVLAMFLITALSFVAMAQPASAYNAACEADQSQLAYDQDQLQSDQASEESAQGAEEAAESEYESCLSGGGDCTEQQYALVAAEANVSAFQAAVSQTKAISNRIA